MHPLSDEDLAAYLTAMDAPEDVAAHLEACAECAGRAKTLAAWERALALASDGGKAPETVLRRLRAHHPDILRPAPRRLWPAWAAAALLIAVGLTLRKPQAPPASLPASVAAPTAARPRILAPLPGVELTLGAGAGLTEEAPGRWTLEKGACLIFTEGREVSIKVAELRVTTSRGEVLLQMPGTPKLGWLAQAWADPASVAGILVLSGSAEVEAGSRKLRLSAGEEFRGGESRALSRNEQARLREALFPQAGDGEKRTLEGNFGTWLSPAPAGVYQASLRLRVLKRPSALGLCFRVGGQDSFWDPGDAGLLDGSRHTLRVVVSPGWVTLLSDGVVRHRVARSEFRANPLAGALGVGASVWAGRVEVSESRVVSLE